MEYAITPLEACFTRVGDELKGSVKQNLYCTIIMHHFIILHKRYAKITTSHRKHTTGQQPYIDSSWRLLPKSSLLGISTIPQQRANSKKAPNGLDLTAEASDASWGNNPGDTFNDNTFTLPTVISSTSTLMTLTYVPLTVNAYFTFSNHLFSTSNSIEAS